MWPEFIDDWLNPQHEELVSQMYSELKTGLWVKNTLGKKLYAWQKLYNI